MRYTILRPSAPIDPRYSGFRSIEELRAEIPSLKDCELESEAALEVRALYPDALGMPIPMKVGSGVFMLLGFIESIVAPRDPDGDIPFVLFVQAVPQHDADRARIKKQLQFSRSLWKIPVLAPPADAEELAVEVRSGGLEQPMRVKAKSFGRTDQQGFGHQVIWLEIGGVEMSIEFDNTMVELRR